MRFISISLNMPASVYVRIDSKTLSPAIFVAPPGVILALLSAYLETLSPSKSYVSNDYILCLSTISNCCFILLNLKLSLVSVYNFTAIFRCLLCNSHKFLTTVLKKSAF